MHKHLLQWPLALLCGSASAATILPDPPRLEFRESMAALPAPQDPRPIDWLSSNQTVYRLNGHIGHWRGELQLPALDTTRPARPPKSGELQR